MGNIKISKGYIIATAILAVIFIAAFVFIHLPMSTAISAKRAEYEAKNNELKLVKSKVKSLYNLKKELDKMKEEDAKLDSLIPNDVQVPAIVKLLEKFAGDNGAKVISVTFSDDKTPAAPQPNVQQIVTPAGMKSHNCVLRISGSYPQVTGYIKALRESPRLFGVQTVSVEPDGDSGRELNVQMTLYFFSRDGQPKPVTVN